MLYYMDFFSEIHYNQEIILRLFLKAWFWEGFKTAFGHVVLKAEVPGLKFTKTLGKTLTHASSGEYNTSTSLVLQLV